MDTFPMKPARVFSVAIMVLSMICICACNGSGGTGDGAADAQEKTARAAEPEHVFTCISPGRWFPGDASTLAPLVDSYIGGAEKKDFGGRIVALISPHAGYQYSGPVAGYAYRQVQGNEYDLVVVVGFSHSMSEQGVGVYPRGSFRTPLGDIPIDEEAARALIDANKNIIANERLFSGAGARGEHSVENQLPFLQRALGGFKLLPVMFGRQTDENVRALAGALVKVLRGRNALIVASTDMSHFWQYDEAKKLDAGMAELIEKFDVAGIAERMQGDPSGRQMCGHGAVRAVLLAAQALGANKAAILETANSQDTTGAPGGSNGVVGYLAAALVDTDNSGPVETRPWEDAEREEDTAMEDKNPDAELDLEARKEILEITRESLESYIRDGKKIKVDTDTPALKLKRGMFVTLEEHGRLRGCMGHFESDTEIGKLAASQVLVSATQDPRFPDVSPSELDDIDIELSILSVPEPVDSYEDIVVGKHGVILQKGGRGATFLPQVAPEQGWDRDTMLDHLAMKAGLSRGSWREGATFLVYTAEVFGEEDVE